MRHYHQHSSLQLQGVAPLLDTAPAEVQEAFQFSLVTTMHQAGKFELMSLVEIDER